MLCNLASLACMLDVGERMMGPLFYEFDIQERSFCCDKFHSTEVLENQRVFGV